MPAYTVRTLSQFGFHQPCCACPWNIFCVCLRFVAEKFTVKKKKSKTKKMYCFYRINLLECVLGVRFEVVNNRVSVTWLYTCNVKY